MTTQVIFDATQPFQMGVANGQLTVVGTEYVAPPVVTPPVVVPPVVTPPAAGTYEATDLPGAYKAGLIGANPSTKMTGITGAALLKELAAGQTYSNLHVTGPQLTITKSVTFTNCIFDFTPENGVAVVSAATGSATKRVAFNNCTFLGNNKADHCGDGSHADYYRCVTEGAIVDYHVNDDNTWTECYMFDHWAEASADHRECILVNSGSNNHVLRCWAAYEDVGSANVDVSSAISFYNQPTSVGNSIQDSYIDGGAGGYAVYLGTGGSGVTGSSGCKLIGNTFGRAVSRYSGYAGAVYPGAAKMPGWVAWGNVWGATGTASKSGDPAPGDVVTIN